MLTIKKSGVVYELAQAIRVQSSIKTMCGGFSVTSTANSDQTLPIKKGDKIQILADGLPILTGFVDSIRGSAGAREHNITAAGRDATQDFVDSSVGPKKQFKGGVSLVTLIENVLSGMGLSSIKVTDGVGSLAPFTAQEIASAEVGETGFAFIEPFCRKRQVLPLPDGLGGIVLVRGKPTSSGLRLVHLLGDRLRTNNVISSDFEDDDSGRFSEYEIKSSGNPLFSLSGGYDPGKATNIASKSTDADIRAGRRYEFKAEKALSAQECKDRVAWECNLRRANSLKYTVTVQGHSVNGKVWKPNQLVSVVDEYWDINAELLISEVGYDYSESSGSTTTLTMTYPDAYTLDAELDALKKKRSKIAEKFKL